MDANAGGESNAGAEASAVMNPAADLGRAVASHHYRIECFGPDGALKWAEEFDNITVNEGLDEILDKFYKGSTYTAAHFVGIKGAGAFAPGDTMASHPGWSELTIYSDATRPAFTPGTVASQSVDNSASKAVFNIDATGTVAGAFLTTDNTKGGSAGILIGGGDFAASRGVGDGDTLNVTITATQASA